jgi:hypothetical protein
MSGRTAISCPREGGAKKARSQQHIKTLLAIILFVKPEWVDIEG